MKAKRTKYEIHCLFFFLFSKLQPDSSTKPGEANVRIYFCCESLVLHKLSAALP